MGLKLSISPKYKIRRITRNSAVHPHYVYQIKADSPNDYTMHGSGGFGRVHDFLEVQRWCQETWGDTMEYQLFYYPEAAESEFFNPDWCYQVDLKSRKYCIYLNEDAMTLFLLRWNRGV